MTYLDSLEGLLVAFQKFKESLEYHNLELQKASEKYRTVMEDDDISKKHIADLNDKLKKLRNAIALAEAAIQATSKTINYYNQV